MLSKKFDIIAVSETWLHKNIYDNEILLAGYTLFRSDRGTKGGGVMLAINDELTYKQLTVPDTIEALEVIINCSKNLIFGIVYIPPNSSNAYHSSVFNFIHSLPQTNNIIIVGDFNYPDIDWFTLTGTNLNSSSFCDLIFDINFVQLVDAPTHIAGNNLDLVLTNHCPGIQTCLGHCTKAFKNMRELAAHIYSKCGVDWDNQVKLKDKDDNVAPNRKKAR